MATVEVLTANDYALIPVPELGRLNKHNMRTVPLHAGVILKFA